MEIITRRDAISRGLTQYFTGLPCKNEHLTYRYTSSGSCAGCIRSYNAPVDVLQKRQINLARIGEMISFRVRVFNEDLPFYRSIVLAASQAREPSVRFQDCWKGSSGVRSEYGSAIFSFTCFIEDVESLKQTAVSLFNARNSTLVQLVPLGPLPPEEDNGEPAGDPR